MTNGTLNRYDQVKESLDKKKKLEGILSQTSHPAPQNHDPANDALKKEIYDFYSQRGNLPQDVITPNDLTGEQLTAGREAYQDFYNKDMAGIFKADPRNVASNIPQKDLETLASQDAILISSEGDDREVLSRYKALKSYEDLKDRYENDKGISEKESKLLDQFAEKGAREYAEKMINEAIEREKERQSKRGYQSKSLLDLTKSIGEITAKISLSNKEFVSRLQKEFTLKGITKQIEESKKEYEDIASKKHDYLTAVRNTLEKLGSSNDPNKFGIGLCALQDPEGLDNKYSKQR